MKIPDWPADERPREKFLQRGAYSLSDAELLAIFLQSGVHGHTAVDLARDLLVRYKPCETCSTPIRMTYAVSGVWEQPNM